MLGLLKRLSDWKVYIAICFAFTALASICCTSLFTGITWPLSTLQAILRPGQDKSLYRQCNAAASKIQPGGLESACDVPNPWKDHDFLDAYVFRKEMFPVWRCQQANFVEKMGRSTKQPDSCNAMRRLVEHGLRTTGIGLDFGAVFSDEADGSYGHKDKMRDLLAVSKVYHADFAGKTCPTCESLVQLDHTLRYRRRPLGHLVEGQRDQFAQFFRDGFTLFKDLGLDIYALRGEVASMMDHTPDEDLPFFALGRRLQHLERIFEDERILQLASFYMGSAVRITGYKILRLDTKLSVFDYPSGHWHHDGCGSRLKLFVYLDDVHENCHPTEIARGSQTMAYFSYPRDSSKIELTRFSTEYVRDHHGHEVVQMLGPRGGGFMFDTNAVHRGNVEGQHIRRDAIIVDIESEEKIKSGSMGNTCPEHGVMPVGIQYPFPAT